MCTVKKLAFAAAFAAALQNLSGAMAENYPSRPIVMVAPLGVGGSTDVIARVMAQGMSQVLGQTIIVQNTTGAGGTIGEARIARATPDGYTIGIGQWGTNVANGAIYRLKYDLMKDFEPVGLIATQPFLIAARRTMPANNLKELIAWLRANGDKTNVGHSGVGTPSHVAGLLFAKAIGANFTMVSYRGAGEAAQALIAGQIDVLLVTPAVALGQLRAGSIKVYAVTAPSRLAGAPEMPTTDEAGLPGFHFSFWHAIWVPKGTPKDIVAKLNDALVKALASPVTREKLISLSQEIFPPEQQTPDALRIFQQSEIDKWWPIIKAANIRAE